MKKAIFNLCFLSFFLSNQSGWSQNLEGTQTINSNEISIIEIAPSGLLWVGLKAGGCVKYDPKTGAVNNFNKTNTIMRTDSISSIDLRVVNSQLHALMSTEDGVYINKAGVWDSISNLPDADVNDISLLQNGKLVFATQDSGLIVYDSNYTWIKTLNKQTVPSMVTNTIYDLERKSMNCNKVYAATEKGVMSIDINTNAVVVIDKVSAGIVSDTVYCISADKSCNNTIALGTPKGLSICNGLTCNNYTTANGLPSNHINIIERDSMGRMWIGTEDSGLVFYDNVNFTRLTKADGLPSNTISDINCLSASCTCYVGTKEDGMVQVGCDKKVSKKLNISSIFDVRTGKAVVLYPQPANNMLHFTLSEQVNQLKFSLFDLAGKLVKSQMLDGIIEFNVPVIDLQEGIYNYVIEDKNGLYITGKSIINL